VRKLNSKNWKMKKNKIDSEALLSAEQCLSFERPKIEDGMAKILFRKPQLDKIQKFSH
jgi:hypothetical protein